MNIPAPVKPKCFLCAAMRINPLVSGFTLEFICLCPLGIGYFAPTVTIYYSYQLLMPLLSEAVVINGFMAWLILEQLSNRIWGSFELTLLEGIYLERK